MTRLKGVIMMDDKSTIQDVIIRVIEGKHYCEQGACSECPYWDKGTVEECTSAMKADFNAVYDSLDDRYARQFVKWLYELADSNFNNHKKYEVIDLIQNLIERVEFGMKNFLKDHREDET